MLYIHLYGFATRREVRGSVLDTQFSMCQRKLTIFACKSLSPYVLQRI